MKNKITTIFFAMLSVSMLAQVSGYMGKRLSVGYTNNFSPAFLNPSANSYGFGINMTHEFNLEYVIKKRTNLCLMYQFLNTGTNEPTITTNGYDTFGNYADLTYYYAGTQPFQLSTKCYGIGFKFFRQGMLAPVGKYKKLDLILYFSELTYDNTDFMARDNYTGTTFMDQKVGAGAYSYKTFGIGYTIGNQRILFNCLVLDYGIRFAILPAGALTFLGEQSEFIESNAEDFTSAFRRKTNYRLQGHQLINAHIGIGFLAF